METSDATFGTWRDRTCSRHVIGKAVQPCFVVVAGQDDELSLCACCASLVPGLAVESRQLKSFRCQMPAVAARGVGLDVFDIPPDDLPNKIVAREGAFRAAVRVADAGRPTQCVAVRQTLARGLATRRRHNDTDAIEAASRVIPDIERSDGYPTDQGIKDLLGWFKGYFTWFKKPARCEACGANTFDFVRTEGPSTQQERDGEAGRVEIYKCTMCASLSRFPRYNNPVTLLTSRLGRCGEFANCFALCCVAAGLETRYVLDVTDHVWVEVWSAAQKRWLHADPCENALDKPRLYEKGWGKKLIAIFAFDSRRVIDVTRRYARDDGVLGRRAAHFNCTETAIMTEVHAADLAARAGDVVDDSAEQAELAAALFGGEDDDQDLGGRTTGDAEWIRQRGEDGSNAVRDLATRLKADASQTFAEEDRRLEFRRRHLKLLANIAAHPDLDKFRQLKTTNAVVSGLLLAPPAARPWLHLAVGFDAAPDDPAILRAPSDGVASRAATAHKILLDVWP